MAASSAVLDKVAEIAAPGGLCHLLRVLPLSSFSLAGRRVLPGAFPQREQAWRELFQAKEDLEAQGLRAEPKLIFDGQTAGSAIVEQARASQAQLIVVAGRNYLLPWWLRDGVAEYVVRHTHLPVLIVPAERSLNRTINTQPKKSHVDIHSS
jgi:nucleotide-binding universal stress UspA family protein